MALTIQMFISGRPFKDQVGLCANAFCRVCCDAMHSAVPRLVVQIADPFDLLVTEKWPSYACSGSACWLGITLNHHIDRI